MMGVKMIKKWTYSKFESNRVKDIAEENGISELLAKILLNRSFEDKECIDNFLHPKIDKLYDPFLLNDMQVAVDTIVEACNNREKITIYGDYDVDGITSITVLKKFLLDRNAVVTEYIPDRLNEGYGLNKNAIKKIVDEGNGLMITVDCGISGIEEIDYANSLGLETIVTDHHEPGNELPKAIAVVVPFTAVALAGPI